VPKETYGQFFTGDSYIVLRTHDRGFKYHRGPDGENIKYELLRCVFAFFLFLAFREKDFAWDVHFWLGRETTQVGCFMTQL
jgi:hypothetical protein